MRRPRPAPAVALPRPRASSLLLTLGLALAACGDTTGKQCDEQDDCSDGQVCAPVVAGCVSLNDCPGVCGDPCSGDDDCEGDETCQASAGDTAICREPTDPGDD